MIDAARAGAMKRGVPSTKMNPRASAPASADSIASSMDVMPQIFTLTTEAELLHLRRHVGRPHQAFAHENRARARRHHRAHLLGRLEPALAHDDGTGRHAGQ